MRLQYQLSFRLKYLSLIFPVEVFCIFKELLSECEIKCREIDKNNMLQTENFIRIFVALNSLEVILNGFYNLEEIKKDEMNEIICTRIIPLCYKISDFLLPMQSLCPEGFLPAEFLDVFGNFI